MIKETQGPDLKGLINISISINNSDYTGGRNMSLICRLTYTTSKLLWAIRGMCVVVVYALEQPFMKLRQLEYNGK